MKRSKGSQTKGGKSKGKSVSEGPKEIEEKAAEIPAEVAVGKSEKDKEEKEKLFDEDEDEEEEEEEEDEEGEDKEIDDIKRECLDVLHNVEYNEFTTRILESYIRMYNAFDAVHASEQFFILKCKRLEKHIEKKNDTISTMKKGLELSNTTINNLTQEALEHHRLMDKVQATNAKQKAKMFNLVENFKGTVDQLIIKTELLGEDNVGDLTGKKKKDLLLEMQDLIHTVGKLQKELGECSDVNAGLKDQIKLLEDKVERLSMERDEYLKQLILVTKEGHCLMNYLEGLRVKVDKSNLAYISLYKKWVACRDILRPRLVKIPEKKGKKDEDDFDFGFGSATSIGSADFEYVRKGESIESIDEEVSDEVTEYDESTEENKLEEEIDFDDVDVKEKEVSDDKLQEKKVSVDKLQEKKVSLDSVKEGKASFDSVNEGKASFDSVKEGKVSFDSVKVGSIREEDEKENDEKENEKEVDKPKEDNEEESHEKEGHEKEDHEKVDEGEEDNKVTVNQEEEKEGEEKQEESKPKESSVSEEKVPVREEGSIESKRESVKRESVKRGSVKRGTLDQLKNVEGLDPEIKQMLESCLSQRNELRREMKQKEDEVQKLRINAAKFTQTLDVYVKKLQINNYQKGNLMVERDKLKQTVMGLGKELELAKKQTDLDRKGMEALMKERDRLSKNLIKSTGQVQEHVKMIQLQEQIITGLETEMEQFVKEANKQRKIISALERDRDRLITEITVLTEQVQDTLDEVQLKQTEIAENKKKIAEGETKFRLQQNLFESVRSDRNKYSKLYFESQDEVAELKQKLKIMNHQTEQLKEDITTKETQLSRVQDLKAKCDKEKENVKVELQNAKDELVACAKTIKAMYEEECKLKKHIQNADDERLRLTKEMEQIMNERDILGSQLIRRNDELSLLYEKIRILQSTLNKGEAQYDQRIEDIRLLKLEIKRLRQDKTLLTRSLQNTLDLRREIKYLERDLTQERLKCRALEEELQTPLNIHRWRKLECTDPTSLELIYKIHLLQKRLLNQSYCLYQKEDKIQQVERCYLELQDILRKRPGPETLVTLNKTKVALREKTELMKVTIAELNMREAELSSYKVDVVRLKDELNEMKKKYYAHKSQHKNCVQPGYSQPIVLPKISDSSVKNRTYGGGFCFNVKNKNK